MNTKVSASHTLREALFDNTLDGLACCQMIFDTHGNPIDFRYIEVNNNFEELTGLKGVVGKKITELIPEIAISNPELFQMYGRTSLTGRAERFETYIAGLSRWFLISVYRPKKNFLVSIFQDITDRKQVEKNLEDAKVAARNVLEDLSLEKAKVEMARAKEEAILLSIGDGLLATDEKGNITLINKTAEKLLDKRRAEVVGKTFSEVVPIEDEKGESILMEKHPAHMALSTGATTATTIADPTY